MLYVTTRNQTDIVTPKHTLNQARASDGGCYLPFHAPQFSQEDIRKLKDVSFNQCVADLLSACFQLKLTAWDVDFCIGRYPVRLQELGSRIVMGETWHNTKWQFDAMAQRLAKLIEAETVQGWPEIAVRIAVLFGIYGELLREGILESGEEMDVSMVSGSFVGPISCWYARQWGLPVGNIVCCCNENNNLWNLICQGQLRTDILSIQTFLPEADVVLPQELERLIYDCGGERELESYLDSCRAGRMYIPGEGALEKMRDRLFVSVVSSQRICQTIAGAYGTHNYLMTPGTALAYAGLLDYRAKKGKLRCSVVLAESSPRCEGQFVAEALGISQEQLKQMM